MNKTAVVIDSTCYMSQEEVKKRGYKVIPLSVNFEDVIFKEKHDNGEQAKKVFEEVFSSKKLPTTSQPAPDDVIQVYDSLVKEGYTKIISLHLTEALSGTVQGVSITAKQYIEDNNLDVEIEVYSTSSAAQVSGIIANEIDDIVKLYGDITSEEIHKIIEHYTKNVEVYFFVDDLNFLHYGGRIPQAFAAGGNILGLTPILTLSEKGDIQKYKIERSQKKGIKSVLDKLEKASFSEHDDLIMMSAHIDALKKSTKILKNAQERTKANLVQVEVSNIGIVIGNHLGSGSFGIGWAPKYKRDKENM